MPPFVIVVDGGIGAGKTVYIDVMCKKLIQKGWRITIVQEPVELWRQSGILDLYYRDPKRWAYHFQTKAFHDRVKINIDAYEKHSKDTDIFILERSPFTDNLFMEVLHDDGIVTDMEYKDYKNWWKLWYKVMPYSPNIFIYLRPSIDVQMARIEERNRKEELTKDGKGGVTREYQEKLVAKHDNFFLNGKVEISENTFVPCINVVSEENYRDDEEVQDKFADQLEGIIVHHLGK